MAVLQTEPRSASRIASHACASRLVVPAGLLIDDATRDRLARQLARAPESIAGVGAEVGPLVAGSSYRVHAEWKALDPFDATTVAASNAINGAVLVRHGVEWRVDGGVVEVLNGSLLVDSGTHVHDPRKSYSDLGTADPRGRSPFPRRPVVVVLARTVDEQTADWARRLVNRLIPRDIEARLLLPVVANGLHLTRPATPSEPSVRALSPDAIVALDSVAVTWAHEWCDGNRSTVVVELDRTLPTAMELVPWQIGRASGRLRARIGPLIDAPALGSLIRRLCAGPHPVAPRDRAARTTAPVTLRRTERDTRTRTCAILTGDLASATRWRLDAIADHMQAVGMTVATLATSDELPDRVADASIVLLSGTPLDDTLRTIVAARHDNGRPTVLDLQPRDVTGIGDRVPVLTEDAARLAEMCGRVTSFGGALHRAALDLGVRALAMPTLLTRRHAAALRAARTSFDPSELVIGLSVGTPNDTDTQYREAAAVGLAKVLADNRDATVSANCEPQDVPALVRSQVQAGGRQDRAAVETAAWFVHLFTPAFLGDEPFDDMLPFTEVAQAGVPTIMPAAARAAVDGFVSPALLVGDPNDPEEWSVALQQVVESTQRRGTLSIEVRQRADAINTAATSKAMINRLVGWAATGTKS